MDCQVDSCRTQIAALEANLQKIEERRTAMQEQLGQLENREFEHLLDTISTLEYD